MEDPSTPSVDDINLALSLYRRLLLHILLIGFGGIAAAAALSYLGRLISPPYGLYIWGWSLGEWGMIAVVVLLGAVLWLTGRRIGQILNDPVLKSQPIIAIMSGITVIARHATAMGMEWSGFLGPLRPVKR